MLLLENMDVQNDQFAELSICTCMQLSHLSVVDCPAVHIAEVAVKPAGIQYACSVALILA